MNLDVEIYIAPHERYEAIEAYGDCLTEEQKQQIRKANRGVMLWIDLRQKIATVTRA